MRTLTRVLLIVLAGLVSVTPLLGCSHAKPKADKIQVEVGESLSESHSAEFVKRYQPDVRLIARWQRDRDAGKSGGRLWVSVTNRSDKTFQVRAGDFAVITKDRAVHRVTPAEVLAQFPASDLAPGASASGTLLFRNLGNLTGEKCVFNHSPEVRPSVCVIRDSEEVKSKK